MTPGRRRCACGVALAPVVLAMVGIIYGTLGQWRLEPVVCRRAAAAIAVLAGGGLGRWCGLPAGCAARASLAWRYGLANLARRRIGSVVQIVAFGLGVMLLLVLTILRRDLIHDWRASLPPGVPNYFFVNIPADQRDDFRDALGATGAKLERMLPMVRGRLLSINGVATAHLPDAQRPGRARAESHLVGGTGR